MLRKFKLVVAGLLVVLVSGVVSYAVSAAVPETLLAAGASRYAVTSVSADAPVVTTSRSFVDVPGLSTSITIPAGKTGDVIVLFCGEAHSAAGTVVVRALVGPAAALPTSMTIQEGVAITTGFTSRCANFYKLGVGAGAKTVKMQFRDQAPGMFPYPEQLSHRSMIVIVNIH
jgi:hypothetical protein